MRQYFLAIKEILEIFLVAFFSILLIYKFLAQPFLVKGASMEPNFKDGDYLLVDEISYRLRAPERGDVVVFRYPGDEAVFYIKRIVGLPKEEIEILGGRIAVSGRVLDEDYLPAALKTDSFNNARFVLGENQYFVLGDNRPFSSDSRRWGPVSRAEIIGEVSLRFWPRPEKFF
jgi:signal peptidase I